MQGKTPSLGYRIMAHMLADDKMNSNLVITTNFDSLVEDALFIYTNKKPLVINHESLAEYAGNTNIKRPIVAKVHRGLFFDPLNLPEETENLKGKWREALSNVFKVYTPIVIGYSGGDQSLMSFLEDEKVEMKNGLYWCIVDRDDKSPLTELTENVAIEQNDGSADDQEETNADKSLERIEKLVQSKNGYLVKIDGFDETMYAIGNRFYSDIMLPDNTKKHLQNQTDMRSVEYMKQYEECSNAASKKDKATVDAVSEQQAKAAQAAEVREKEGSLTALDYLRMGNSKFSSEKYNEAIEYYKQAIDKQPDFANAYSNLAFAYHKTGDFQAALDNYRTALSFNPDLTEAYSNRGVLLGEMNRCDEALRDFDMAILLGDAAKDYNNRGYVYYLMGDYDKAMDDYKMAIMKDKFYAEAHENRAVLFDLIGENVKAESERFDASMSYSKRGLEETDPEKSLKYQSKAIKLVNDYYILYNRRGYTYSRIKEYQKAIEDFTKSIQLNGKSSSAYTYRGEVYYQMGDYDNAIKDLDKAITLNIKNLRSYELRAKVYRAMGLAVLAEKDEKKALRLENANK